MFFDQAELDCNSTVVTDNVDSRYYSPQQYANLLQNKSNLKIIHMNVRSLTKNKDKIESLLLHMPVPPDIIAITETKLNSSIAHLVEIKNYSFIHVESKSSAGGVGMYINKKLAYLQRSDITIENEDCESMFIEILNLHLKKKSNVIVGVIYRHPRTNYQTFQSKFCNILHKLHHSNSSYIISGDFNIDVGKQNSDSKVSDYLNDIYSAGSYLLINKPTRITSTSSTTLDHIYSNHANKICYPGILIYDISDHLPIFCSFKTTQIENYHQQEKTILDMKHFNTEGFCNDISYLMESQNYSTKISDPELAMSNFINDIRNMVIRHTPLKKLSRKEVKTRSKPWLTKGLLKSIKTKNRLFCQCYKQQKMHLVSKYKKYLHKLTRLKQIAKKNYYQNELNKNKNNLSLQWKLINEIISHKKYQRQIISVISDMHNKKITDKQAISNLLNNYFTNVGPSMDAKIPKCQNKDKFKLSSLLNSFQFELISSDEVNKQLSELNTSKACGFENVPNKLYKIIAPIISPFLADIFNKCYDHGTFPSILKYAKVIPLYKTGPKDLVNNYRPISLLSPIAKIFEKLLYVRLDKFFSCKKVINSQQFGFRKGYSTELAITDLHNRVIKNTDNGYYTCCIFIDLSKAFDTVNHSILLDKLYAYGIRGNMYSLLKSYLSNRKQFTWCNNTKSENSTILCGVPQGSTLGPLFFSLYVNDLPTHTNFNVNLFADDTVLTMKDKNLLQLQKKVNCELAIVDEWMKLNRLSLNYSKSTYFIIKPAHNSKNTTLNNFNVSIGLHKINSTNYTKYLGILIDQNLKWNNHINLILQKLANAARILCTIRHYVNKSTLRSLYFSFVYPHLKYGIIVWGNSSKSLLHSLQVMQNKIVRIMSFKCLKDHVYLNPLFKSWNLLKINEIYELEIAKFMHSYYNKHLPENFDHYFKSASNHHSYSTRSISNQNYYQERYNLTFSRSSCSYNGVLMWNKIPLDIKKLSFFSFNKKMKAYLVNQY